MSLSHHKHNRYIALVRCRKQKSGKHNDLQATERQIRKRITNKQMLETIFSRFIPPKMMLCKRVVKMRSTAFSKKEKGERSPST